MADVNERFRIDPMVVFKLGQELISDETQALLELIKNAYDADASYVAVRIDTQNTPEGLIRSGEPDRPGFIELVDDGHGMDRRAIRDGWLLIARSPKSAFKRDGKLTDKKRTPLGDKGLGRLGVQRLGWGLQISTKTAEAKDELVVAFSWEDFFAAKALDEVDVQVARRSAQREKGTTVVISELISPEQWQGERLTALQRELSQVISPYEGVSGFQVSVSADGVPVDLRSLNRQVRDTAQLHYDITFDGERLTVAGKATLGLFRPQAPDEREAFASMVEADGGKDFFDHLSSNPKASAFRFRQGRGKWFVSFSRSRLLTDVVPPSASDVVANPGSFRAEVDSFDLGAGADERLEVFGRLNEYRDFIKELAGIRVYRDGFAIRVDQDWLGLGRQWTSARSYYGLKPDTTTGYVALTGRDNPQLIEKTDREGFTDNPHYRALRDLMADFLGFTGEVQGFMRREFVTFFREKLAERAEVEADSTPEKVSDRIDAALGEASAAQDSVAKTQATVAQAVTTAQKAMAKGSAGGESPEQMRKATAVLESALGDAQVTLSQVSKVLAELDTAQARNRLLREEINSLRDQLAQGVEAMGLGLTAEALSHEMFNIADDLATRTQTMSRDLRAGTGSDRDVLRYIEHVRGTVGALRKELGHFAPSLRYVRDRRDRFDVASFTADMVDYYAARWRDDQITVKADDRSKATFDIRTSRGRLTQVFDNLLLNSHYWVTVAQKQNQIKEGSIRVTLRRPFVVVSDNGPGVEPSAEESLFDPFVTRKPRGTGRGLGLFIVNQLLEADGCSIELGPARNDGGRRYEFHLNLSGLLDER